MASSVATQKFRSNYAIQVWDHDPGTTNPLITSPDGGTTLRFMDMRDLHKFAAIVTQTVLGGSGVTKLEIIAAPAASATNAQVIKDSGTIALDALAEWAMQECTAEEIAQASTDSGFDLRYVAARITCQHSGDEAIVTYIGELKRPHLDATAALNTL